MLQLRQLEDQLKLSELRDGQTFVWPYDEHTCYRLVRQDKDSAYACAHLRQDGNGWHCVAEEPTRWALHTVVYTYTVVKYDKDDKSGPFRRAMAAMMPEVVIDAT